MPENFVDVVGYQLEKVHTGVIAWLLDSERPPLTVGEQATLVNKLSPSLIRGTEFKAARPSQESVVLFMFCRRAKDRQ
jgi:hypothetical protein